MKLLIDNHEPSKIAKYIESFKLDYEIRPLPVGDIICEEKGVIVERKDIGDWVMSIRSGHLQKQLQQMTSYPYPYLIISGKLADLFHRKINWTVEQHAGALASCMIRYPGLRVMWVENDKQLIRLVKKIVEKTDDGRSISIRDTELLKNRMTVEDMRIKLLCNFEGIGRKKSEKLLETDREIVEGLEEFLEFMRFKGIYKE